MTLGFSVFLFVEILVTRIIGNVISEFTLTFFQLRNGEVLEFPGISLPLREGERYMTNLDNRNIRHHLENKSQPQTYGEGLERGTTVSFYSRL